MAEPDALFSAPQRALLLQAERADPPIAAELLMKLAASFLRAGQAAQFAECFKRSYALRPIGLFSPLLRESDDPKDAVAELHEIAQTLLRHGVAYSPVLAALAITEAQLGNVSDVRRLVNFERFFHHDTCAPPAGMNVDDFHRMLVSEIKTNLKFHEKPEDGAVRHSWVRENVLAAKTPALLALRRMIEAQVDRYIAALPDDPKHPFIAARPTKPSLIGWAVVSDADGYVIPHLHPAAWLSGIYYVAQPEVSRSSWRGWLRIGPPDRYNFSSEDGWDTRMIEPACGTILLMPSFFYHATEPMGVKQERISIAFDVRYSELRRLKHEHQ